MALAHCNFIWCINLALQNIIECFDELDLLSRLNTVAYAQTIDRLMDDLQHIVAEHSEPYDARLSINQ